jgi:hypothetical protein
MEISCCIRAAIGYTDGMTSNTSQPLTARNSIASDWRPSQIRDLISRVQRVRVWFRKKDGTIRSMIGTVEPEYLAARNSLPTSGGRFVPDNQICLFDVEKGEWRSFRADNMIQVEVMT